MKESRLIPSSRMALSAEPQIYQVSGTGLSQAAGKLRQKGQAKQVELA